MTPKEFNKAMGAVVRQHRMKRGLSQSDIAEVIGVSYQQVQKSEYGINGFAAHYLPKIAKLLGLKVGTLFQQAARKARRA